jgi:hypothetical protein
MLSQVTVLLTATATATTHARSASMTRSSPAMKDKPPAHNIASYWSGIERSLSHRLESVREYLTHPSSGVNAEHYFRQLLRDYLPQRFSVEPGFVVNDKGEKSDFIDALIVDTANIAPLSTEPTFKIFAAEAVVGAIEITSAPKAKVSRMGIAKKIPKLSDDLLKLAKVRQIAKIRKYVDIEYELPPRCFLITFGDEWTHWENYRKHLIAGIETARHHGRAVWVNATWSVRHGMFHFRPHETGQIPTRVHENALLEFIFFINTAISSVRTDMIDVTRYRPSARRDVEPAPEGTRGSGR